MSLIARVDYVDTPIVADIEFVIKMEWKLFYPEKLFLMKGGIEYPIDFTYSYAKGVSGTISGHQIQTGDVLLRLEGMPLAYSPRQTEVWFERFDITTSY